jgi:hypothetical protein
MSIQLSKDDVRRLFSEVDEIQDESLREGVIDIWIETAAESNWEHIEDVPKSLNAERYRRLVDHVRGVTRLALAIAEGCEREQGAKYNRDYLLAACLLHDASKIVETDPDPTGQPTGGPAFPAKKSLLGKKIQHGAYATHKIFAKGLPLEVAHLVLTHTHASNVRSPTLEAAYLFYADYADSDAAIFPTGEKTFSQRWEL